MQAAADYCLVNNINLQEGLTWAERSINTYFGESNFLTLSTYAGLLEKFNRKKEADSLMQIAFPKATVLQLLVYGHQLTKRKKYQEAFSIFKKNYEKFPNEDYANLGMVIGHYFMDNKKEAIAFAEKAMSKTKDPEWKKYFGSLVTDIGAGKDLFR